MTFAITESLIQGWVAPGFEAVEEEFRRNFAERGEIGAACAVCLHGEPIVDLWGGYRDPQARLPWEENTLVGVFSVTKGMAAAALALAHARGWLDYDAAVADYWPAFAQAGKEAITVRQLLGHQAGLSAIDEPIDLELIAEPDRLADLLARQKPCWAPGRRHGYHPLSLGWYESELLRRVDPAGRTLGRFFREEVANPLGLDFHIGLPENFNEDRLAAIQDFAPMDLLKHLDAMPWKFVAALLNPWSLTSRSFRNPSFRRPGEMFSAPWRHVEVPAANGIGLVRSVAKLYGMLAQGGEAVGLGRDTFAELCAPATPPAEGNRDQVIRVNTSYSLGFVKPFTEFPFAGERAFGSPGMGGSFGFADPDTGLGYAYVPSKTGFHFWNDPREAAFRSAVYRCLEETGSESLPVKRCGI